jgi:hypothetical protein
LSTAEKAERRLRLSSGIAVVEDGGWQRGDRAVRGASRREAIDDTLRLRRWTDWCGWKKETVDTAEAETNEEEEGNTTK